MFNTTVNLLFYNIVSKEESTSCFNNIQQQVRQIYALSQKQILMKF